MTNTKYVEVWKSEIDYVKEVFTRDQMLDQLGYASTAYGWTDCLSDESLAIRLAHKRIGDNYDGRLIPASHSIREFLNR